MILVGDIGGTNARFAIAMETDNKKIVISDYEKFKTREFKQFDELLEKFVVGIKHKPHKAILAVAGPVKDGKAKFTNQNWLVDNKLIEEKCRISSVEIINDFAAMAMAVPKVGEEGFIEINRGEVHADAPTLVSGPGTGFGSCILVPQGNSWRTLPCEGGHSLFSPRDETQIELVRILQRDNPNISVENFCGGKGLNNLARAVCELKGHEYKELSPHEILEKSETGEEPYTSTCTIRAEAIMSSLANMALVTGARGGVVIAGGVAKHLVNFLSSENALEAFTSVWPDNDMLKNIPIRLLIEPTAPLLGAAAFGFTQN